MLSACIQCCGLACRIQEWKTSWSKLSSALSDVYVLPQFQLLCLANDLHAQARFRADWWCSLQKAEALTVLNMNSASSVLLQSSSSPVGHWQFRTTHICSQFSDSTDLLIFLWAYDEDGVWISFRMGMTLSASPVLPDTTAFQPLLYPAAKPMADMCWWRSFPIPYTTNQYIWTGFSCSQHLVLHAANVQENKGVYAD